MSVASDELTTLVQEVDGNILVDGTFTITSGSKICSITLSLEANKYAHIVLDGVEPSNIRFVDSTGSKLQWFGDANTESLTDLIVLSDFDARYVQVLIAENATEDITFTAKITQEIGFADNVSIDLDSAFGLKNIKQYLSVSKSIPTYTENKGYYIDWNNGSPRLVDGSASYVYTTPIKVNAGDIIRVVFYNNSYNSITSCLSSSFSAITKVDENGTILKGLLRGTNTMPKITYRVEHNGYVSISFAKQANYSIELFSSDMLIPYGGIDTSEIEEIKDDVDILEGRVDELNEDVNNLKKTVVGNIISQASMWGDYENKYLNIDGTTGEHANSIVSPFISVVGGTDIYYNTYVVGTTWCVLVEYAEDMSTVISYVNNTAGTGGVWGLVTGKKTLDANTKYIRFAGRVAGSNDTLLKQYLQYSVEKENADSTLWNGKKWICFGTSITDTSHYDSEVGKVTGKYVPYLVEKSGLVVDNQGIAGGTIATGGIHGGSGNILTKIKSTDLSNADLVTIEGFVNDFACAVSIGEIGDTTNANSMIGAIYDAVTYIQNNSNARVVLITEHTGRKYTLSSGEADYEILKKNSLDLLQKDYNDAIKLVGALCNVPVIDAGGKAQISQFHTEYLIDHLHHTELGGQQYAQVIWDELKNISPIVKE